MDVFRIVYFHMYEFREPGLFEKAKHQIWRESFTLSDVNLMTVPNFVFSSWVTYLGTLWSGRFDLAKLCNNTENTIDSVTIPSELE